jgi:hypothetical protein
MKNYLSKILNIFGKIVFMQPTFLSTEKIEKKFEGNFKVGYLFTFKRLDAKMSLVKLFSLVLKYFSPNLFPNPYNKTSPKKGAKKVPKGYF